MWWVINIGLRDSVLDAKKCPEKRGKNVEFPEYVTNSNSYLQKHPHSCVHPFAKRPTGLDNSIFRKKNVSGTL